MTAVEQAWARHRRWSVAAGAAQKRIAVRRRANLVLLVTGALAGAVAVVWGPPSPVAPVASIVAALALSAAGIIQARFLAPAEVARWSRARAASEAVKAEVYRFLVGVAPYDGDERDDRLNEKVDTLGALAGDQLADLPNTPDEIALPPIGGLADYREKRARHQAGWHRGRIDQHLRSASRLRAAELAATAVGAVLAAIGAALKVELAAWTTAAAAIAAAVAAHAAAARHDRIAASYAATADQLERLLERLPPGPDAARAAQFVVAVERVLAEQNEGWTSLIETA